MHRKKLSKVSNIQKNVLLAPLANLEVGTSFENNTLIHENYLSVKPNICNKRQSRRNALNVN